MIRIESILDKHKLRLSWAQFSQAKLSCAYMGGYPIGLKKVNTQLGWGCDWKMIFDTLMQIF